MYEPVIGLEIHAQLLTKTKLFCGCSTEYGKPPNSLTCPVCLGLPGALPVLNGEAVTLAIKFALAVKAQIHLRSTFSRKNYFYPDLPKGYQITQYHFPIATEGQLKIETNGNSNTISIERINLEEDAGKSIHEGMPESEEKTYLDFNRSGVPLLEIVGRPEINSSREAVEFLQLVRTILQYLDICDGNMEEGSLRCDANLSVRKKESQEMGVKTEIKNLNSFRFLQKALEYEEQRQIKLAESGKPIRHETRFWDSRQNKTLAMRSKEEVHDYRYFPEPDLPPLIMPKELIDKIKKTLPELPQQKAERFVRSYRIPSYAAKILAASKALADYFEQTAIASKNPKQSSNWMMREVLQHLKDENIKITQFSLAPQHLAELVLLVDKKEISLKMAKEKIFPQMVLKKKRAPEIIREQGLSQFLDADKTRQLGQQIIKKNPRLLKQYQAGKHQVLDFFIGQVMKETKGTANPHLVNKTLREILDE